MHITPVDSDLNLFKVTDLFPQSIVDQVIATDWLAMPWHKEDTQSTWARRWITATPWMPEFEDYLRANWDYIGSQLGVKILPYVGTSFWLDEPGFTCSMHTDGELPGAIQTMWAGSDATLGTTFYWDKDGEQERYRAPFVANSGYSMINQEVDGYRKLLWHAMLTPVPVDSFRLTSYTIVNYST